MGDFFIRDFTTPQVKSQTLCRLKSAPLRPLAYAKTAKFLSKQSPGLPGDCLALFGGSQGAKGV
jgi:hypothetical protein